MRKEVLFALILGSLIGIGFAFSLWKFNPQKSALPQTLSQLLTVETPAPSAPSSGLTIASPLNNSLITTNSVAIKGAFHPQAQILISSDNKDVFVATNEKGEFSTTLEPLTGINSLLLTSFSSETTSLKSTFVYSTVVPQNSQSATPSASIDPVRENLVKKIDSSDTPVSFSGKVTDKTETGIQIEQDSGEIIQAIVAPPDTIFVRVKDNKELKFEEVGLGDYVAVIGFPTGVGIINTKRVLIDVRPDYTIREVRKGIVKDFKKTQFGLQADKNYLIKSSNSVKVFKVTNETTTTARFSDITNEATIIVVGKLTENDLAPRSIFILQ